MVSIALISLAVAAVSEEIGMTPAGKKKAPPPSVEEPMHKILIDGESFWVTDIKKYGWNQIEGFKTEYPDKDSNDKKYTYFIFESTEDAGSQARKDIEDKSDEELVEEIGLEPIVEMARGNSTYIGEIGFFSNLKEYFEWIEENPGNYFARKGEGTTDLETVSIHPDDEDEMMESLGLCYWDRFIEELGFEPSVAILESTDEYW